MKVHKAAERVQKGVADTLNYYHFPHEHWRQVRINNLLEKIMCEIRRRSWVVGLNIGQIVSTILERKLKRQRYALKTNFSQELK